MGAAWPWTVPLGRHRKIDSRILSQIDLRGFVKKLTEERGSVLGVRILHFEPSLGASSSRSDVISAHSLHTWRPGLGKLGAHGRYHKMDSRIQVEID